MYSTGGTALKRNEVLTLKLLANGCASPYDTSTVLLEEVSRKLGR
jgi:hypothetical protein